MWSRKEGTLHKVLEWSRVKHKARDNEDNEEGYFQAQATHSGISLWMVTTMLQYISWQRGKNCQAGTKKTQAGTEVDAWNKHSEATARAM